MKSHIHKLLFPILFFALGILGSTQLNGQIVPYRLGTPVGSSTRTILPQRTYSTHQNYLPNQSFAVAPQTSRFVTSTYRAPARLGPVAPRATYAPYSARPTRQPARTHSPSGCSSCQSGVVPVFGS